MLREAWMEVGGDEADVEEYDQPMELDVRTGLKRGAEDDEDETNDAKIGGARGKRRREGNA